VQGIAKLPQTKDLLLNSSNQRAYGRGLEWELACSRASASLYSVVLRLSRVAPEPRLAPGPVRDGASDTTLGVFGPSLIIRGASRTEWGVGGKEGNSVVPRRALHSGLRQKRGRPADAVDEFSLSIMPYG
jgi:hypothetical protein